VLKVIVRIYFFPNMSSALAAAKIYLPIKATKSIIVPNATNRFAKFVLPKKKGQIIVENVVNKIDLILSRLFKFV
jgi:hypothetical protein